MQLKVNERLKKYEQRFLNRVESKKEGLLIELN